LTPESKSNPTAFIVLNPVAGISNPQALQRTIENRFEHYGWKTRFHVTTAEENIAPLVRQELERGVDLVVAVGGDGTIAAVAAGMVNSPIPLGVIPTGTWNAIARHLAVPFNVPRAVKLMTGNHKIKKLDLMAVGETYQAMNLSIGVSSSMIAGTGRNLKRKWGNMAYFSSLFKQIFGLQQRRYTIIADGRRYRGRAAEIFVANYGVVGMNAIEAALEIKPDDGKVDVLILRARTILDLPALFWQMLVRHNKRTPKYRQIAVEKSLVIHTSPPEIAQSDGEIIGKTPVTIKVLPRCVNVIVPVPLQIRVPSQVNLNLPSINVRRSK
jgi:YegS/Rv2252/BmrU family lipid kinase